MTLAELKKEVADFPRQAGCYLMRDAEANILYVGKAKLLRDRVLSYFQKNIPSARIRILMKKVRHIECVLVNNECEALILENTLIKEHQPFYNVLLKDGKSYPVIRVTKEDFPLVFRTRRIVKDGSRYYGPFPDAYALKKILELIEAFYPLRKCRPIPLRPRREPCLFYHMGRCLGPCIGAVSVQDYEKTLQEVEKILKGNVKALEDRIRQRIHLAVEELRFEDAARYRDLLGDVQIFRQDQKVESFKEDAQDYLTCWKEADEVALTIVSVRNGKLLGREFFFLDTIGTLHETLEQFLLQYYEALSQWPSDLFLPEDLRYDTGDLSEAFYRLRQKRIRFHFAQKGHHRRLLDLAQSNLELAWKQRQRKNIALDLLGHHLGLPSAPLRIEGIDIAHIHGHSSMAALVSFWMGKPDKKSYRAYAIKSLSSGQIDDYKAMREVIARRFRSPEKIAQKPDLLVIDGGKGQLHSVLSVLEALEISVPVCALAKEHEEIFLPGRRDALKLPQGDASLAILQAVRDEAHRFSRKYNKQRFARQSQENILESIPGIGPQRSRTLLQHYGSYASAMTASKDELQSLLRISSSMADQLLEKLRNYDPNGSK